MSDTVDYDSVLGLLTPPDADKQVSNASTILAALKGQSPQVVSNTAGALARTTTHPTVAATAAQLQSDAKQTMTQTTRGHLVQHPDTNAAVDRARVSLNPSATAFTPEERAASDAMERQPWATNGFAAAYANASPQDRADLLRSRALVMPSSGIDYDGVMGLFQGKPAAGSADAIPAMPARDPSADYWAKDYSPKPGSDPYSDALYAKTGSGNYERPGESWSETYARNSSYDQAMRNAGVRKPASLIDIAGNAASSVAGAIAGGYRGLWTLATGGDAAAASKAVTDTQNALTYVPRSPESQAAINDLNTVNPLNIPARAGDALGGKLAEAGLPGLGAAVATAGAAAPMLLGASLKARAAVGNAARGTATTVADLVRPPAKPGPRIEPTMTPVESNPSPTLADVAGGVPPAPNLKLAPQQAVSGRSEPFPAQAPSASLTPKQAGGTKAAGNAPAANAPTFSDAANGVFAESNPDVAGGLPASEQARRAQVLKAIGLDDVRKSALTGDANQAAIDFQTSRLKGSPAGDVMSQQLANEKAAIQNYAEGIAHDTGGSAMNDQAAKLARGNAIVAPLDALKSYFDDATADLYKTADERAQGVPTELDGFRTVLGDDSQLTNSDRVHLQAGINAYAKKLGILRDDGTVFANAQQAETMRKYLNENWSPQNSGMVSKLKDALDDDVTKAAGEDVYGAARAMRAQRAATLDNPNGIANLLDASGPNAINRKVPIERIADTVTNMPVAQLSHVIDTLKKAPPEIQPQAQTALAEIKAQFAHNVSDIGSKQAGQWNAKGVRQYLANNSARMQAVFAPDEMQRFGTLNDAGNILAKDQSYPGAFAQQQNLLRAGVSHAITSGATAAGGVLGGPIGGAAGGILGSKIAGSMSDAAALRSVQKRLTRVSDLLPPKD